MCGVGPAPSEAGPAKLEEKEWASHAARLGEGREWTMGLGPAGQI